MTDDDLNQNYPYPKLMVGGVAEPGKAFTSEKNRKTLRRGDEVLRVVDDLGFFAEKYNLVVVPAQTKSKDLKEENGFTIYAVFDPELAKEFFPYLSIP